MITRRRLLQSATAATAVVATTAVPTTAGPSRADDKPFRPHQSEKFRGDGWYAFDFGPGRPKIVQYAAYDGRQFIELSDGPDMTVRIGFSAEAFDCYCLGYCHRVGRDGRVMEATTNAGGEADQDEDRSS